MRQHSSSCRPAWGSSVEYRQIRDYNRFPYLYYQRRQKAAPKGQESTHRLRVWSGLLFLDNSFICLYSTLLPQAGRQLELCWRTSWDSHPSEDLSELRKQKYHYRLTGLWRNSLPRLSWPEWVSLCTLYGRPLMRNAPHRWSSRTRPDAHSVS